MLQSVEDAKIQNRLMEYPQLCRNYLDSFLSCNLATSNPYEKSDIEIFEDLNKRSDNDVFNKFFLTAAQNFIQIINVRTAGIDEIYYNGYTVLGAKNNVETITINTPDLLHNTKLYKKIGKSGFDTISTNILVKTHWFVDDHPYVLEKGDADDIFMNPSNFGKDIILFFWLPVVRYYNGHSKERKIFYFLDNNSPNKIMSIRNGIINTMYCVLDNVIKYPEIAYPVLLGAPYDECSDIFCNIFNSEYKGKFIELKNKFQSLMNLHNISPF